MTLQTKRSKQWSVTNMVCRAIGCLLILFFSSVVYFSSGPTPPVWDKITLCMTRREFMSIAGEPSAQHWKTDSDLWRIPHLLGWYELGAWFSEDDRVETVTITCYIGSETYFWKQRMTTRSISME
ncbi:MAG: hypothetical protein D6E12_07585 [Desulfovibrio sp.]|nr:MAG: hypothetical protein D6E12_07585 [Desulfovibrio sp.]